jgi:hypothetical protein
MYGVGMPILFIIAAFNFLNTYISERIVVAYFMRQPPALDDKMTKNALDMIKFAPLLMLLNGFWMLSSPQIFLNKHSLIQTSAEKMKSGHYFEFEVKWHTPICLMCLIAVFLLIIQKVLKKRLTSLGFSMQSKELEVDEDLPNFNKTLKLSHAEEILAEELNM